MKKLILLAAAMLTLTSVSAQNKDIDALNKRLEKSDATIADAKKAALATTWIDRARIYTDMANVYTKSLIQGFPLSQAMSVIGAPSSEEEVELRGVTYKKCDFQNVVVYVTPEDGNIAFWTVKSEMIEKPLEKAYDALVKAKEIAVKEFVGNGKGLYETGRIQAVYQADGMSYYNIAEPLTAAEMFQKSFEAGELVGEFDTTNLYYSGINYYEAERYEQAIKAFDKVLTAGNDQDGNLYYYISDSYSKSGNNDKAIELLESGLEKHPKNNTIITSLINVYLTAKKDPLLIVDKIHAAQALEPNNLSLYLVESSIYNEIGDMDNALATLDKIAEIDPKFFTAYYNYAIVLILKSQELREKADNLDMNDNAGYKKIMDDIVAMQAKAIEKLEKAHEVEPTNKDAVNLLKQLYFPRREDEKGKERYEYFEKLNAEMEAAQ